jgi:hypothetical protein
MSENNRDAEMSALEAALTSLAPRRAGIDRDRLMFQAGQRAARRRGWVMPSIAAVLASAVTLAGALLLHHPEPRIVRDSSPLHAPSAHSRAEPEADESRLQCAEGLRLRNEVLQGGLDAIPKPPITEEPREPLNIDTLF